MYRSVGIKGFRCFKDFEVEGLAHVNLLVGRNNVGKTTLLEALFLHCGRANPQLALRIQKYRGMEVSYTVGGPAPWDMLFHNTNHSNPIEIQAVDVDGCARSLRLSPVEDSPALEETDNQSSIASRRLGLRLEVIEGDEQSEYRLFLVNGKIEMDHCPSPPFPGVYVFGRGGGGSDDVERFSELLVHRHTQPVVEAVKLIEPRLRELTVLSRVGSPAIWADIGLPQLLPVHVLGDGVRRLLSLVASIVACSKGVVLIDEIDAGLHHATQQPVWHAIMQLALELDVQIFATTHSHECLVAARNAASEFTADFLRIHRLDRVGDRIEAVTYDREALDGAIAADLEVR